MFQPHGITVLDLLLNWVSEEQGGYLAIINSDKENATIYSWMSKMKYECAYIGYSCNENEEWGWVLRGVTGNTQWMENQPDYTNGNYALILLRENEMTPEELEDKKNDVLYFRR